MIVLAVHNFYQQPGGEDAIFHDETNLMEAHGHRVVRHTVHNDAIDGMSKLTVARKTIYNKDSYRTLRDLIQRERPDVVHFHNHFPLISPAGYDAAKDEGLPVIQNVQNYRFTCLAATLYRDGHVCEDCLGKSFAWSGVIHRCYRGSAMGSAVVAMYESRMRMRRTWQEKVDAFIVPNEFMRAKMIEAGLPFDRLRVKPNFVAPDPGAGDGAGGYAVFVGRLTVEKGVLTMLDAWPQIMGSVPLKILGDGPLRDEVRQRAAAIPGVEYLGRKSPPEVSAIVGAAAALICPSEWYEGQPKTVVEAFARGTPVIGSSLGALVELVRDDETGLRFKPGVAASLAEAVTRFWGNRNNWPHMRETVRRYFDAHFTSDNNYRQLLAIYEEAIAGGDKTARESDHSSSNITSL